MDFYLNLAHDWLLLETSKLKLELKISFIQSDLFQIIKTLLLNSYCNYETFAMVRHELKLFQIVYSKNGTFDSIQNTVSGFHKEVEGSHSNSDSCTIN